MNWQRLLGLLIMAGVFVTFGYLGLKFISTAKLESGTKAFITLILGLILLTVLIIIFLGLKIQITI